MTKTLLEHVELIIMYVSAMSIIVKASGQNDSDDSIVCMQLSMLIEVILSGGSIHASSSPKMEYCHHFDVMCAIGFLVFSCCLPML